MAPRLGRGSGPSIAELGWENRPRMGTTTAEAPTVSFYFRFPAQRGRPSFSTPSGVGLGRIHGRVGNLGQCREMIIRYFLSFDFPTDSGAARLPFPISLAAASSAATVTEYGDPLVIGLEVFWTSRSWHGRLGLPGIWPESWRSDGLVGIRHCRCRGGPIRAETSA